MTIQDIIDEVVGEVGGDSDDSGLQSKMLAMAKGALRRMIRHTRQRAFITTSSVTLSSGSSSASLPSGFIRELPDGGVYRVSSGSRIEIEKHPHFNSIVNTETAAVPSYYEIRGSTIYFDRKADQDYTIYIVHFQEIDSITLATTWSFDSSLAEILKDGIKYTYYRDYVEDGTQKAQEKLALFKNGLDELDDDFMIAEHGGHIEEA